MLSVWSTDKPVVFTNTVAVPLKLTPLMPIISTVPVAFIANVPSLNLIKPIFALRSRTPVASGLISPLASFTGPWPRNTSKSVPAKIWRSDRLVKLTLPSMVTKSPMLSDKSSPNTWKTFPSDGPNLMAISREPAVMVSSTAPPVLLMRKPSRPLTLAPPPEAEMLPVSTPATPDELVPIFQSSRPLVPSSAARTSEPFKLMRLAGREVMLPTLISFTSTVPTAVPSLFQSSRPFTPLSAEK